MCHHFFTHGQAKNKKRYSWEDSNRFEPPCADPTNPPSARVLRTKIYFFGVKGGELDFFVLIHQRTNKTHATGVCARRRKRPKIKSRYTRETNNRNVFFFF